MEKCEQLPESVQSKVHVNFNASNIHESNIEVNHPEIQNYDSRTKPGSSRSLYYFDNRKPPSLLNTAVKASPSKDISTSVQTTQKQSVSDLTSQQELIKHQEKLLRELQAQNQDLKNDIAFLHENSRQVLARFEQERQSLIEQKDLTGKLHGIKVLLDSKLSERITMLQSQNAITEAENKQQKLSIATLTKKLQLSEERLFDTTKRMEKSVRTNRVLIDRASDLDQTLSQTHQKWLACKKEYEHLERWVKSHKDSLDDYEGAIHASNLYASFPEDISKGFPRGTDLLTRQVKTLLRERNGKLKLNENFQRNSNAQTKT